MSIDLKKIRVWIGRSTFVPPCISRSSSRLLLRSLGAFEIIDMMEMDSYSCTSSSIGRNSYCCGSDSNSEEVDSPYRSPFDRRDDLVEALPMRKGISKFYCGKSKSFMNLADARSASSSKYLGKLYNNAHSRRHRHLVVYNSLRNSPRRMSKRPTNSIQRAFALQLALSSTGSTS